MTAPTPEEFYKSNIGRAKEYVRVFVAREIRAGEEGLNETMTMPGPGYELRSGNGSYVGRRFMTAAAFAAKTVSIDNLALPVPKNDPADEGVQDIAPITEGAKMVVQPDGFNRAYQATAVHDGILFMNAAGKQEYMSNFELSARFNYVGQKVETRKEHVVMLKDEAPVRGILLDEETTFLLMDSIGVKRTDKYPANTFLYPDRDSPFGYSFEIMKPSPNMRIRVLTDFHGEAVEKQARLNARAPRVQLRP